MLLKSCSATDFPSSISSPKSKSLFDVYFELLCIKKKKGKKSGFFSAKKTGCQRSDSTLKFTQSFYCVQPLHPP